MSGRKMCALAVGFAALLAAVVGVGVHVSDTRGATRNLECLRMENDLTVLEHFTVEHLDCNGRKATFSFGSGSCLLSLNLGKTYAWDGDLRYAWRPYIKSDVIGGDTEHPDWVGLSKSNFFSLIQSCSLP